MFKFNFIQRYGTVVGQLCDWPCLSSSGCNHIKKIFDSLYYLCQKF